MSSQIAFCIEAVIALLVITAPFDPVKLLIFEQAAATKGQNRFTAALTVAGYVAIILVGAALVGKSFLKVIGINLDVFGIVGGLVVALMGFEMLYGGKSSKTQGEEERARGPEAEDQLLIPLALPLIAGPGAITATITIATEENGLLAALAGAAVVTIFVIISFTWLAPLLQRAKPATMAVLLRIGGLLLATIGVQMMLTNLKNFF